MTKAKKLPPVKIIPPGMPTKQVSVKVNLQPNEKPEWQINAELYIINMNSASPCTREIIMSDRIISIDGICPKSATDAAAALMPGPKPRAVQLVLERRLHAVPVTPERLTQIKTTRLEGFSYFLVNCINSGKGSKGTLGFTLSVLKQKAHIVTVEPGSIAAQHFGVGDALLDIDGVQIPFSNAPYLKKYSEKFFTNGRFSVVIERPTTPQRIEQYGIVYKMLLPQTDADIEMGADAVKIGMEAAAMHTLVFKKVKPRSCLTADIANAAANTTMTTMDETDTRKIKISTCSVSTAIGSDVDDEDDLRKVERKSHSKEQMNFDDL